jgi:hypothetical protein
MGEKKEQGYRNRDNADRINEKDNLRKRATVYERSRR